MTRKRICRTPRWAVPVVAALALLVTGCSSSPPSELEGPAKALGGQINSAQKGLDKAKADFHKKLKQPKYAFMARYTAAQRHEDLFAQAKSKLDKADKIYGDKVKPQVEDYNGKKADLAKAIADATKLKDEALKLTANPTRWVDEVASVKADSKGTLTRSTDALQTVNTDYVTLEKRVEAAKTTYSKNADAIGASFQPLTSLRSDALQANGLLQAEAAKSSPNFAVMATQASIVTSKTASYTKDGAALESKFDQLDTRETHTLVDARVDSTVYISRTSWDEGRDYPDEHDYDYPKRTVDVETANYFAEFNQNDVLAKLQPGSWGGVDFKLDKSDKAHWEKLRINAKEKLHGDDTAAEFYIELDQTYCHQVQVFKNGKPGATSPGKRGYCSRYDTAADTAKGKYWVATDELRTDLIGMDLYAKEFGQLPDQALTNGVPPGIAYVGDSSTGEWREDDDGHSFWYFYGQYAFFNQLIGGTNPYYYRSDWDDWGKHRKSKRPYYGAIGKSPRFGAKSPFASSRFPGSNYSRNLHGTTVRSAGPSARGGGPSGGGK